MDGIFLIEDDYFHPCGIYVCTLVTVFILNSFLLKSALCLESDWEWLDWAMIRHFRSLTEIRIVVRLGPYKWQPRFLLFQRKYFRSAKDSFSLATCHPSVSFYWVHSHCPSQLSIIHPEGHSTIKISLLPQDSEEAIITWRTENLILPIILGEWVDPRLFPTHIPGGWTPQGEYLHGDRQVRK